MPHHKSVRLGHKIKAALFILPLLALLAVVGLAVGQAYAPTPAEATHGGRGPSGPPGSVVDPVVTAERELHRRRHVSSDRVLHQFRYSVQGVRYTNPDTDYAQWFDLDWSENDNGPWHSLIRGGGLSSFVSASLPAHLTSAYVRVRGNNQHSPGPWSGPIEVSFTPYVSWVSAEANLTTATLRWSAVGGSEIHKFQVSGDNGGTWKNVNNASATSYTFNDLTSFTDYTLRVRPCRADGSCTHGPAAFVTTNGPDAAPGPLTNLSIGVNTCRTDFRWNITPPEITETAGKAVHYEFQWRLDSDSGDETAWSNLTRSGNNPKFRNTSGYWTVPAALETVTEPFGNGTRVRERSIGKFHMRVRALNAWGAGPWVVAGASNQINSCPTETTASPVDTTEEVEPQAAQSQEAPQTPESQQTSNPPQQQSQPAEQQQSPQGQQPQGQPAQQRQSQPAQQQRSQPEQPSPQDPQQQQSSQGQSGQQGESAQTSDALTAVTNVVATVSGNSVVVTWAGGENAANYVIVLAPVDDYESYRVDAERSSNSATFRNVAPGEYVAVVVALVGADNYQYAYDGPVTVQ